MGLSIFACLSSRGGSYLPCNVPSFTDPRRVTEFSICLGFHLLLGWSGDFQAPYMWNLCVLSHFILKINFIFRTFKFTAKSGRKTKNSHVYMHSLTHCQHPTPEWYICYNQWSHILCYHWKSIVYIRVHTWCCPFYSL